MRLPRLAPLRRSAAAVRVAGLAPFLATLVSLLAAATTAAASGGADFPIWRR